EVLGALTELRQEGKIRIAGCSNETCWGVMKSLWTAEKHNVTRYETVQNNFSVMNRRCENELAQVCRREGVSLLAYSPLGGGVLTGKYNDGIPADGRFAAYVDGPPRQRMMAARFLNDRTVETTRRLGEIARDLDVPLPALALAWSKQHDFVASTIVGATSVAQLNESLVASDLVLSEETLDRIDEIEKAIPNPMTEDGLRRL
ncbi:MAG: aldo/keto reductase, partial [Planctomycetales bacterium]|nr:aldo/keto reductase [Planctomycetales bacterium]